MVRGTLGMAVLIASFANGCAAHTARQIDADVSLSPQAQEAGNDPSTSQMVVHIDPLTGLIIVPPAKPLVDQFPQTSLGRAERSLPQLEQTLSSVPGGGVMIQLDDRFLTPLTARIDIDGTVHFEHKPSILKGED
jgi:hypothetical protein